jgi:hypothetical protein
LVAAVFWGPKQYICRPEEPEIDFPMALQKSVLFVKLCCALAGRGTIAKISAVTEKNKSSGTSRG